MKFNNIDITKWERSSVFNLFSKVHDPIFSIGLRIQTPTDFVDKLKSKNMKPFIALLYSVSTACNNVENFRYRLGDKNSVKLYDRVHPAWVELDSKSQLVLKTCKYDDDFFQFTKDFKSSNALEVDDEFAHGPYISTSTQPWYDLTSLSNIKFFF